MRSLGLARLAVGSLVVALVALGVLVAVSSLAPRPVEAPAAPAIVAPRIEQPVAVDQEITLRTSAARLLADPAALERMQIAPDQLAARLGGERPPLLLDVRTPQELLLHGRIAGAVNLPLGSIVARMSDLPQDKTTPIVTYCQVGSRGAEAMATLRALGYTNVLNLRGGLDAWARAGLPLVAYAY